MRNIYTDFYDKIRRHEPISNVVSSKVSLKKKGNEYSGICPFHSEKTPSFTVNDFKNFYHCFGCGAHGDSIKFISETSGMQYKEAANFLADRYGIARPKISKKEQEIFDKSDYLYKVMEIASQFYHNNMSKPCLDYINKRKIPDQIIESHMLGYGGNSGSLLEYCKGKNIDVQTLLEAGLIKENENFKSSKYFELFSERLTFPIKNIYGKIIGFGGRRLDDKLPKYINSPDTIIFHKSEHFYGEHNAINAAHKTNRMILVEGYMDVISFNQIGVMEAVASLGTAVNEKHLQKIWRYADAAVICLDGDEAGSRAANKLIDMALEHISAEKRITFVQLPQNLDPDSFIKQNGKTRMLDLLSQGHNLSDMIWLSELKEISYNNNQISAESKAALEKKINERVKLIKCELTAKNFREFFKNKLWLLTRGNKNNFNNLENVRAQNLAQTKLLSEQQMLEDTILLMIAEFPELLKNEEFYHDMQSLSLNDEKKQGLKEAILSMRVEEMHKEDKINSDFVAEYIKKAGFFNTFLVLCEVNNKYLDLSYIKRNPTKLPLYFKLTWKKLFLIKLKEEYSEIVGNILVDNESDHQLRLKAYVDEIQAAYKDIQDLTNNLSNI